jgi:hypothetical protein
MLCIVKRVFSCRYPDKDSIFRRILHYSSKLALHFGHAPEGDDNPKTKRAPNQANPKAL